AVDHRPIGAFLQFRVVGVHLFGVVARKDVRVVRRRGDQREDLAGRGVERDGGAALVTEGVLRRPLGLGVERELDGAPALLPAGDQGADARPQERIVGAVEHVVLRQFHPGRLEDDGEEPGDRCVQLPVGILALELERVLHLLRIGDRLPVDDDRPAVPAVFVVHGPGVAGIGAEVAGLAVLHPGRLCHEREEHDHHEEADPANGGIHKVPLSSSEPGSSLYGSSALPGVPGSGTGGISAVSSPRLRRARPVMCSDSASCNMLTAMRPVSWETAWTGAGRRAPSDIRMSRAIITQFVTSEVPPAAANGNVSPVSGMRRVTPPTTTNTWNAMENPIPVARSLPKPSRTPIPARRHRCTRSTYIMRMAMSPVSPSSSPREVKMKSELE